MIRRGLAMKSAFSHLEAAIRPSEILVMSRNKYVRGASITPWTANEFPLSDEERAEQDKKIASNKALEEITILATGGGVVSESTPQVLSMARRYGLRAEEHAAGVDRGHDRLGRRPSPQRCADAVEGCHGRQGDEAHPLERLVGAIRQKVAHANPPIV